MKNHGMTAVDTVMNLQIESLSCIPTNRAYLNSIESMNYVI